MFAKWFNRRCASPELVEIFASSVIVVANQLKKVVSSLEALEMHMTKNQEKIDALTARAVVQGQTIDKIFNEVRALKEQYPDADFSKLDEAFEANDERLKSLDDENPDAIPPDDLPPADEANS